MSDILDHSEDPTLDVLRCEACDHLDPGPRELCPNCHQALLVVHPVSARGRLVSWTVIRRPPTRFRQDGIYAIVIVDLSSGVRVTGRIVPIPDELQPGAAVHLAGYAGQVPLFKADLV